MTSKTPPYSFDIIFQKLDELKESREQSISAQELKESQEINELRKIALDISEDTGQCFSTA